jgi:hypothetical protein
MIGCAARKLSLGNFLPFILWPRPRDWDVPALVRQYQNTNVLRAGNKKIAALTLL